MTVASTITCDVTLRRDDEGRIIKIDAQQRRVAVYYHDVGGGAACRIFEQRSRPYAIEFDGARLIEWERKP